MGFNSGFKGLNNRHLSHSSHIEQAVIVTESVNLRSKIKLHTQIIPSDPTAPNSHKWEINVSITYYICQRCGVSPAEQNTVDPYWPTLLYRVIQNDGLNFVRLYFLNYTWYAIDLHNIWKRRS